MPSPKRTATVEPNNLVVIQVDTLVDLVERLIRVETRIAALESDVDDALDGLRSDLPTAKIEDEKAILMVPAYTDDARVVVEVIGKAVA